MPTPSVRHGTVEVPLDADRRVARLDPTFPRSGLDHVGHRHHLPRPRAAHEEGRDAELPDDAGRRQGLRATCAHRDDLRQELVTLDAGGLRPRPRCRRARRGLPCRAPLRGEIGAPQRIAHDVSPSSTGADHRTGPAPPACLLPPGCWRRTAELVGLRPHRLHGARPDRRRRRGPGRRLRASRHGQVGRHRAGRSGEAVAAALRAPRGLGAPADPVRSTPAPPASRSARHHPWVGCYGPYLEDAEGSAPTSWPLTS